MALITTLLKALKYQSADTFRVDDEAAFRKLVVWLEDTKIRLYKPADRTALRAVNDASWPSTFAKYLAAMECPLGGDGAPRAQALEWMLVQAVGFEYQDNAEKYTAAAATAAKSAPPSAAALVETPELAAAANDLCAALGVPAQGSLAQRLTAAADAAAALAAPSAQEAAPLLASMGAPAALGLLPPGFDTGDAQLNNAASVLRALFVRDLRALQTAVDRALVEVQELTADPRTDSKLGKVGR
ncbi:unnamed protein product [Pedinophyceae sp. YPF-701]|nr:unnamed protein product [Pedinophyceae sp. YPF-701]